MDSTEFSQEFGTLNQGQLNMNSMDGIFSEMYQNDSRGQYGNLNQLVAAGLEALNSDKWIKRKYQFLGNP